MTALPLKDRLQRYFERNAGIWFASGDIQRLVTEKTSYTPSNASRRLRELENEGVIEVRYEKNHAYYRHKTSESTAQAIQRGLQWFDSLPGTLPHAPC
jgi:DNA-binding transcriptional ArsR family regulator